MNEKKTDVGVIVGRFQVPFLHAAHIELIDSVVSNHPKVVMFLGLSPCLVTRNNPLDFDARKRMIQEKYPDIIVLYIKDIQSDDHWSQTLDKQIHDVITPNQTVTLYGGRDGFISHYTGKFKTVELEAKQFISGTELRNSISKSVKKTDDFRCGVIWAAYNQHPKVYTTVDIAILDGKNRILLGRKPNESKYCFIGGFSSPTSSSFEEDAKRELQEETGIETDDLTYIGSTIVNDWRYRGEIDKIKTIFFKTQYVFGAIQAGDDIAEVRWFKLSELTEENVMDYHLVLVQMLLANLKFKPVRNNSPQI